MVIWKEIEAFDGKYSVSNTGLIRNNKTLKILKQTVHKTGYYFVSVKPNGRTGKCKTFRVHREVAKHFIPNPENKPTVNHKDANKLNNNISNLEWATHTEQASHAKDMLLLAPPSGTKCHFSRLTEEQISNILDNPHIKNIEFAKLYNIDRSAISKVRSGKNWKHFKKAA